MGQIQVFQMKTRILDFFWDTTNLDNEGDEFRNQSLQQFNDELTKSLDTQSRTAEIRWEVSDDSGSMVQDFANEQNKNNGYK
jgi:hypothetical protein